MSPAAGRTAVAFHAKDDPAEVRREVFKLLLRHSIKFIAIVRDKRAVVSYVRERNARDATYRYSQNELYDQMVRRLFKERLHKGASFTIEFARRGSSDRTAALRTALDAARARFQQQWNRTTDAPLVVKPSTPKESCGLQAADYLLWALQRLYERDEDRYLTMMWPKYSLVIDADSVGKAQYGAYYTQRNPLLKSKPPADIER